MQHTPPAMWQQPPRSPLQHLFELGARQGGAAVLLIAVALRLAHGIKLHPAQGYDQQQQWWQRLVAAWAAARVVLQAVSAAAPSAGVG